MVKIHARNVFTDINGRQLMQVEFYVNRKNIFVYLLMIYTSNPKLTLSHTLSSSSIKKMAQPHG